MRARGDNPPVPTKRISEGVPNDRADLGDRIFLLAYHRDAADVALLQRNEPVIIGRDAPATLLVDDASLSRVHARFTLDERTVMVVDLGSTNGTWVAGRQVDCAELHVGDEVVLGGVRVSIFAAAPAQGGALGVVSHERFRSALDEELTRARHFGRSVAVLMIRGVRSGTHVSRFIPRVRAQLQVVDRIGLYSDETLEVVCPEVDLERALEIGRALAEGSHEGEAAIDPLLVGIAVSPEGSVKAEELCELSREAAQRARAAAPVQMAPRATWSVDDAPPKSEDRAQPVVESRAMRGVYETVARLGRVPITVLIHGETGTGKEVVARALHAASARRKRHMIVVNCAAIPAQLVESTLFGHVKGSFTGAFQDQKGVFEAGDGSTVFLDEVGELSLAAQAALLRVLDTGHVTRVGSPREIVVDVRVLAATHRDLEVMCHKGAFREDLFYRLNGTSIVLPPLRQRVDEIEPLVDRFLRQANQAWGTRIRGIAPDALASLTRYRWPGNVRELRNAIHRAVAIAQGDVIAEDDLPERVRGAPAADGPPERGGASSSLWEEGLKEALRKHEIRLILEALDAVGGNQAEAARRLKVPLRTLAYKIKSLGIHREGFKAPR